MSRACLQHSCSSFRGNSFTPNHSRSWGAVWSFRPALILACVWIFLLAPRWQWHRPWGRAPPAMQLRVSRRQTGASAFGGLSIHVGIADWLDVAPGSRAANSYGFAVPPDTEAGATVADTACPGHSPPATCTSSGGPARQQHPRRLSAGDARGTLPLSQTVHTWLRTGPTCHCRTQATPQGVRAMSPSKRNHFFSYIYIYIY